MAESIFYAFFAGIIIALFYGFLRINRFIFGLQFLFDLIFWIFSALFCFSFLLVFNNGAVRWIYFAVIFFAFSLYSLTVGRFFAEKEKKFAKKVKIRLKKVKKSAESFKKVLQLPLKLYYNKSVGTKRKLKKVREGENIDKTKG